MRDVFFQYMVQAGTLAGTGAAFAYQPPTEDEEEAFRVEVAQQEEEADLKKPKFIKDFDVPRDDWVKWIGDHLELEVSIEVASIKITPTTIEFEGWVAGLGGGIKLDMLNSSGELYSSLGPKAKIGIKAFGIGVEVEGRTDFIRKTTTWEFESGKYSESYTSVSELKGTLASGEAASVSGGVKVQIDSQLHSKVETTLTGKIATTSLNAKEVWE
jgi:hypothetical protein